MTECYRLFQTEDFEDWLEMEDPRSSYQIDERLAKLRLDGHFGTINNVSKKDKPPVKNRVWELKFNDGRRIYYSIQEEENVLLLLGGNKNGQNKDINRAKTLYIKSTRDEIERKPYG